LSLERIGQAALTDTGLELVGVGVLGGTLVDWWLLSTGANSEYVDTRYDQQKMVNAIAFLQH
jgi:hypothetical protein